MLEQALDFREECDTLFEVLEPLSEADWLRATQFKGWTVNDVVTHLHFWNRAANLSLEDEATLLDLLGRLQPSLAAGGLRKFESDHLVGLTGRTLLNEWREFYRAMSERWSEIDPKRRLKWAGPDMSARSSITARLMETWAHGQAVFDLLGIERMDRDRIKNIAVLGVNTLGWTFKNRGLEAPDPPPQVRLTAPSGAVWEWNAPNASDGVEGNATEFCQVVTQVRNVADTNLRVTGETTQRWMSLAQCFAGPPETPPAPGTRFVQPGGLA